MTTRRSLLFVGSMLALLAACGPPPEVPKYPDLRFTGEPPILLEASQIEIRTLYQPSDADRAFPVPPVQALQNWARDRLRASGRGGPARFTIGRASTTTKDLPIQGGISGTFTDQLSQQYDVAIDATLELLDEHGMALRTVHVTASRSQSVLQSATPNDREKARYDLVKAVMASVDQQLEQQIRNNFGLYLLSR
jgi:hypothetical protein